MAVWTSKYLPKNTKEVLGQQKGVEQLKDFVVNYKRQKNKCCMLYGGIGCGKTSAVIALANELSLELVEMNSSDFRDKEKIEQFIGTAIKQQSLFFRGKLILIDELDGLSGTEDRGGVSAILSLVENSTFAIVCTVNDPYEQKLSPLRKASALIEFHTLDYRTIANNLLRILDLEKCEYDEEAVKALARREGGDMRAAINDLQTATNSGEKRLDMDAVNEFETNERNRTEGMMNALLKVLKTTDIEVAKASFENVDEDIDTIKLWLEENIPKEYEGNDLRNAMMCMSKADVYQGRIRRWQHWRFLVYINMLYSAGIALSKNEKYQKFVKYGPPSRILKLWQAKMKYEKKKGIAEKIAAHTHASKKRVIQEVMPYIKIMSKDKDFAEKMCNEFDLEEDEIEWIKKENK